MIGGASQASGERVVIIGKTLTHFIEKNDVIPYKVVTQMVD